MCWDVNTNVFIIVRQNNSHATTHKKSLEKLKDTDPEFFKFLNNESKELLNFSSSESEGEADENHGSTKKTKLAKTNGKSKSAEVESASEADSDEDDTHRPPQKLLVCILIHVYHVLYHSLPSYHWKIW